MEYIHLKIINIIDFSVIVLNKSFDEDLIKKYEDKIDFSKLSERSNLSNTFIKNNLDRLKLPDEKIIELFKDKPFVY